MATCAQPGEDWTVVLRRQPARIVEGGRPEGDYTDVYEIVCRSRCDHPGLDCREVSPRLQLVRGPYPIAAGVAAYEQHLRLHQQLERATGTKAASALLLGAYLAVSGPSRQLGDEDPAWATVSATALWVLAAGSMREDGGCEARRIAAFLTEQVRDHDSRHAELPYREPPPGQDPAPGVRPLPSQLRRLIAAAVTWCQNADLSAPLSIPPVQRPKSIAVFARDLPGRRDFTDWTYRAVLTDDDETFVVIEEADGSQRLLRDTEARARDTFTWGYGGTGPHTLAEVLVADVLAGYARCPACMGAAPCGAGVAHCRSCGDAGRRGGTEQVAETLVRTLISQSPQHCCWVLTRRAILTHITEQATPAGKGSPLTGPATQPGRRASD